MPKKLVINTSPLISLIAGLGDLQILRHLYDQVIVPKEVCDEITIKGNAFFDVKVFLEDDWLKKIKREVEISRFLKNSLDKGEAAVVQTAVDQEIDLVCIDEIVGRRIARLHNLKITSSLGIVIAASKRGVELNIERIISNVRKHGIWIGQELEKKVLNSFMNKERQIILNSSFTVSG
ncbi:MAG TPA: hypothetical protein PLI77_10005 [Bacteroidales bacterium]|nr:hypothetical protein [Bacteroidales bacterium]